MRWRDCHWVPEQAVPLGQQGVEGSGGQGPPQAQARLGESAWPQVSIAKWVPMGKLSLAGLKGRLATCTGGLHGGSPGPPAAARPSVSPDGGQAAWLTRQHFSCGARWSLSCGSYSCQETAPSPPRWASAEPGGGGGRQTGEDPQRKCTHSTWPAHRDAGAEGGTPGWSRASPEVTSGESAWSLEPCPGRARAGSGEPS